MQTLRASGATLAYEVLGHQHAGEQPLLAMVGHPMGADGFRPLAERLAGERPVLLLDPRGFGASPLDDPEWDAEAEVLGDDLSLLLAEVAGDAPVDVFGSSGGAISSLALLARHPQQVRLLVAHEPPLLSLLPDAEQQRARALGVAATYREQGLWPAMGAFLALVRGPAQDGPSTGEGAGAEAAEEQAVAGPPPQPSPEQVRDMTRLVAHSMPLTLQRPDVEALRAADGRLVVAVGSASGAGEVARRSAEALAAVLGTDVVRMPGGHGGFADPAMGGDPDAFAESLRAVLARGPADQGRP